MPFSKETHGLTFIFTRAQTAGEKKKEHVINFKSIYNDRNYICYIRKRVFVFLGLAHTRARERTHTHTCIVQGLF
jgi:hypothetical protein